ncbi:hypothetical protein [Trinickia soli]|uniref:hypothetical protein n=1 Tax=Trinickia soli TaxID=380675 RepID=UPI003FA3A751
MKARTRAASSGDERLSARTAVEPEPRLSRGDATDAGEEAPLPLFDPRQGTLVGFELPADVFASIAGAGARGDTESAVLEASGVSMGAAAAVEEAPAAVYAPVVSKKAAVTEASPVAEISAVPETPTPAEGPDATRTPAIKARSASAGQSVGGAKPAAARKAAPRRAASPKKAVAPTKFQAIAPEALVERFEPKPMASADAARTAEPSELARTVASLQETIAGERHAAQERWRQTQRWFALALAGLALLLVVSVAQMAALIAFAHRAQAERQQAQAALSEQQAALANLASATSALSASAAARPAPASAAMGNANALAKSAQEPMKRVKATHARHAREKVKPAAAN